MFLGRVMRLSVLSLLRVSAGLLINSRLLRARFMLQQTLHSPNPSTLSPRLFVLLFLDPQHEVSKRRRSADADMAS
jgi:hypothetical protein